MSGEDLSQENVRDEEELSENGDATSREENFALDLSVKTKRNQTNNSEANLSNPGTIKTTTTTTSASTSKRKTKPVKSLLLLKCVNEEEVHLNGEEAEEETSSQIGNEAEEEELEEEENIEDEVVEEDEEAKNESSEEFIYTQDDETVETKNLFNYVENKPISPKLKTIKKPKQQQQSSPQQNKTTMSVFKPPHAVDMTLGQQAKNISTNSNTNTTTTNSHSKKQMRFQCRFCVYKSHSVSLMQNHIYRHIDTTPYSCFYCGHKSTTKSTIMVHIELCHPNMEVKIKESRVKEEDYYLDLNSSDVNKSENSMQHFQKENRAHVVPQKFEIMRRNEEVNEVGVKVKKRSCNNEDASLLMSASPSLSSSPSPPSPYSLNSSPSISPAPNKPNEEHDSHYLQLQLNNENLPRTQDDEDKESNNYVTVFNRPKQYFGSLYEPDKQYSCKLCSYTTNHKPSMEDHVYVHTNKRPYQCGYCGEEIYTRYAATYHNKYKHPGEARNFIKDEQDVSIYYVNRAKQGSCNNSSSSSSSSSTSSSNNSGANIIEHSANEEDFDKKSQPSPSQNNNNNNKTDETINQTKKQSLKLSQDDLKQKNIKKHKKTHESATQLNKQPDFFNPAFFSSPNPQQQQQQPNAMTLAQLMLSNAAALASNPSQPISSTSSPPSKSSSTSSSTSTSPQQQQPPQQLPSQLYDFNLALKMYQYQIQNLMATNYLQTLRSNNGLFAGFLNSSVEKQKSDESNSQRNTESKRKFSEANEVNNESSNVSENDEAIEDVEEETENYSQENEDNQSRAENNEAEKQFRKKHSLNLNKTRFELKSNKPVQALKKPTRSALI